MEFNPASHIIQLCIQGMELGEKGKPEEASSIFLQAWNESIDDFEKFTSAYYVARHQETVRDPNVTDKKFPGNPTRSYRSQAPLRIVGEVTDWVRQTLRSCKNGVKNWQITKEQLSINF